jgi:opacity protein-like surface antigen
MGGTRALWAAAIVGLLTALCPARDALAQAAPPGVGGVATPDVVPTEDTLDTTYGLAMGSGARAGAVGVSALAYNTSNMAAVSTYDIDTFSQLIPGSKSNGGTYWTIGSSISDSTTSKKIAMGTSFRGVFSGENRRYSGWDWRSGIGIQAVPQLGLGVGFRWAKLKADRFEGQRIGPSFEGITMDASLTVTPIPWLRVSGLGYNLIKTNSTLAPQMAGASVSLAPVESFSVGGDMLFDFTTFSKTELIAGAGVSYTAAEMVPLRLGYRRDRGRNLNQITAGAGFAKGKVGAEVALRQDIGGRKESYILMMFRIIVQ